MLFGELSGQKRLQLKMDKICRPGPFRMTWPIYHWLPISLHPIHESAGIC